MWIGVISLFPEMFQAVTDSGITRRAVKNGLLALEYWAAKSSASLMRSVRIP